MSGPVNRFRRPRLTFPKWTHFEDTGKFNRRILSMTAAFDDPELWLGLAADPNTAPEVLTELVTKRSSKAVEYRVLELVASNPASNRRVLYWVLTELRARLGRPGERPNAAALALMMRPECDPMDALALGALPGASARFHNQLRKRREQRWRQDAGWPSGP